MGSAALSLVALAFAALAHTQQTPPRQAPPTVRASAVLSGTVVSDDVDAAPVRHVRVTCVGLDAHVELTVVTDDLGRFTFAALPAGRYTIRMTKAGWVPAAYGAKGPLRPGTPIALADAQKLAIVARLPHGAVLTGIVLDENAHPSVNTIVRAMRWTVQNGERRLITFGSAGLSDDRGVYRIFGLPAGDYIIGAAARSTAQAPPGAEVHLTTELDVHHARTAAASVAPPPDRGVAFASTFFPGTPLAAQAAAISLRAGEERDGIDFALQLVATARVEGYVYTAEGPIPPGTQVTLLASGQTAFPDVPFDGLRTTGVGADGAFAFSSVSPGQYTLLARSPAPLGWASTDIVVDGDRVSGLSLSLQPGLTMIGLVAFKGDRLRPPADLRTVRVALRPIQSAGIASIAPAEVAADASGRFAIAGVTPGRYQLHASFPGAAGVTAIGAARPGGWFLRSATIGGQDSLDAPITIQPGQPVPPAVIEFADRSASLTGTVQSVAGEARDYTVVIFPADPALWQPRSRRIDGVSPASDGTYTFTNLVAGQYLLTAMDDVEAGEWFDPAFLQRIAPLAIRIAIADGEGKVQDLRVGRNR